MLCFCLRVGGFSAPRLLGVVKEQGFQPNQTVLFLSEGGYALRHMQHDFWAISEHILDWFHLLITGLTVLAQCSRGLPALKPTETAFTPQEVSAQISRLKHHLWQGSTVVALETLDELVEPLGGIDKLPSP